MAAAVERRGSRKPVGTGGYGGSRRRQDHLQAPVKDVPVDGFWSLTVYDSEGYFQPNEYNAYSVNSLTAKKGPDGSVTIQFGGCDGKIQNCLPITPEWNYTVRLFEPRAGNLDGTWRFPEVQPVN